MPRNNGVYEVLPGVKGIAGQTIRSGPYNAQLDDFAADLNAPRPQSAGGTGATSLALAGAHVFPSRADATAANIPAVTQRIAVLHGGMVLGYIRDASGTALTTADGATWSPSDDAYVEHWGGIADWDESTGAGTDNATAINAATSWCATLRRALFFRGGRFYRVNSRIRINVQNVVWEAANAAGGNSAALLMFYNDPNESCVWLGPENDTTPSTGTLNNLRFRNIAVVRTGSASTMAAWHFRRCGSVTMVGCIGRAAKWPYLFEGCRNVDQTDCTFDAQSFPGAAGSAAIKIDTIVQTDGTNFFNFTHKIRNMRGASDPYDATIEIGMNDYTVIEDSYLGKARIHVLLKPSNANARIISTDISNTYLDGTMLSPTPPTTSFGVVVDAPQGRLINTTITGGRVGQVSRAVYIKAGSVDVGVISLSNVVMLNSINQMIFNESTVANSLALIINGGTVEYWRRDQAGTDAAIASAVRMVSGQALIINGVYFNSYSTKPVFRLSNVDSAVLTNNIILGADVVLSEATGNNNLRVFGNITDAATPLFDTQRPISATNFGDDAAAAAGGVIIGGDYRTGNNKKVRIT